MKKPIKIDMSADLSLDAVSEILSDAITDITGNKVSEIICKYGDDGKFQGFRIIFSDINTVNTEQVIDRSFRPMRFG